MNDRLSHDDEIRRVHLVAEALSRVSSRSKPMSLADIERLMAKIQPLHQSIIAEWTKRQGDMPIIYQPDITDTMNFLVKALLDRFHTFSKEELMLILVIGHAQIMTEMLAAATNAVKYVKPGTL